MELGWGPSLVSYRMDRSLPRRSRCACQLPLAPVPDEQFSHSHDTLVQIAKDVLDYARSRGATAAETEVSEGFG